MAENKDTVALIPNLPADLASGNKCFEFNYDFKDHPTSRLIKAIFMSIGSLDIERDSFPVITSVRMLDNGNKVELKKVHMLHNFHNQYPYPEETVIIDRS